MARLLGGQLQDGGQGDARPARHRAAEYKAAPESARDQSHRYHPPCCGRLQRAPSSPASASGARATTARPKRPSTTLTSAGRGADMDGPILQSLQPEQRLWVLRSHPHAGAWTVLDVWGARRQGRLDPWAAALSARNGGDGGV
ncbi:hypothetical protein A1Q2_00749 [Trichosporon asahii var. asahii CBS 8904]|uniref:Uncharacterized protein n=1 Tax=Trichosporon asahii var. asahii (strain CBS 8904) TaxID=1220162 RepID=K1WVU8_TRIAC|nr:hypothetical protein A1Q2_00749 [Trichosporon asahii var. asahii CBS 8904]